MLFEHYLITRFNLPIFFRLRNGNDVRGCDPKYLEERFRIFEEYCLPSVINQTCQNFKWIILFDNNTPLYLKTRASGWKKMYDNIFVFYLDLEKYSKDQDVYINLYEEYASKVGMPPYRNIESAVGERIQRIVSPCFIKDCIDSFHLIGEQPDYYITTRLDNDDAIHSSMIERVQTLFNEKPESCLYNYHYGYEYHFQDHVAEIRDFGNGHFTSLVESSDEVFQSVFYWSHQHVKKFVKQYDIYNDIPLFVELIHGNNAGNKFYVRYRGLIKGYQKFTPKQFGYRDDMVPSLKSTISYFFKKDAFVEHFLGFVRNASRMCGTTYLFHKYYR